MKIKTAVIASILSLALFTACTDKKKSEEKDVEIEVVSEEKKTAIENTVDEDEKRIQDSIRQVKEHGHAH